MTLAEYLANRERGELSRLHHKTLLAYSTLHALAYGKRNEDGSRRFPACSVETARKIEAATGGAVTVTDIARAHETAAHEAAA